MNKMSMMRKVVRNIKINNALVMMKVNIMHINKMEISMLKIGLMMLDITNKHMLFLAL